MVVAEAVDDGQGSNSGMDVVRCDNRRTPELGLEIDFEGEVVGEVVVQASAERVDVGGAGDVGDWPDDVATVLIINLAAADEEINVRAKVVELPVDADAGESAFLGVDGAGVDGIGAPEFNARVVAMKGGYGQIYSGGYAEVSAAFEVGIDASSSSEGREMYCLASGGERLCTSPIREKNG
jgi:hypothetical protein